MPISLRSGPATVRAGAGPARTPGDVVGRLRAGRRAGLLWGSFANVCIYRWPAGRSVVAPGSHCVACQAPIRWYDNVPVLAWL